MSIHLPGLAEANWRQRAGRRRASLPALRFRGFELPLGPDCGTIIRMRLSEVSRALGELPADGLTAGDRGSPITAHDDQPDLAVRPRPDWQGRDQADGSRGLAERLARLPEAHPSAWSGAVSAAAERSSADWSGARTGGEPPGGDIWWRGESDAWWRIPDRSADEAGCGDDTCGLVESGELADSGNLADADAPAGPGRAADADATGEAGHNGGGRGPRRVGPAPGSARPDHGPREGRWGGTCLAEPEQSGPDRGHYRPWFSADAPGEPWFAAGPEYWADS